MCNQHSWQAAVTETNKSKIWSLFSKLNKHHNKDTVQKENMIGFCSSGRVIQGYLIFLSTFLSNEALSFIISKNSKNVP